MTDSQTLVELAKNNNGIITNAMVMEAGISRGVLKYLSDSGRFEKVARGVYTLPDAWEDEFVNLQTRFKRGIFSLETALFLCDLTDRTPSKYHMTFPASYNLTGPKSNGLICSSAKEPLYSLGITELQTPSGNTVKGYCAERTLCDIVRPHNHTDVQIVTEAFKRYVSRQEKNIPFLAECSRILHIEEKVRTYLEVLL